MKQMAAIGLLLLCTTILGWASGSEEAEQGGPTVIRTYIGQHVAQEGADYDEYYWTKFVEDTFAVELEFTIIPQSIAGERMNIALAAGELPDMILGQELVSPIKFDAVRGGMFLPLEDRIAAGEGWRTHPYWDILVGALTEPDGHIYTLPRGVTRTDQRNAGGRFFWNTVWMDELGVDVPTTVEEVYDLLLLVKTEMPDVIPVSGLYSWLRVHSYFMNAFGMKSDFWSPALSDHVNIVDDQVVFTWEHPNYGPYLEFMSRLYNDGLLDPEYFTQTDAQLVAKAGEMKYFMFGGAAPHVTVGNNANSLQYSVVRPVTSDYNPDPWWPEKNPFSINAAAIPTTSEQPDKAWEILDWTGTLQGESLIVVNLPEWHDDAYIPAGLTRENVLNPPIDGVQQPHKTVSNMDEWSFLNQYLSPRGSNIPGLSGGWSADSRWGQSLGVQVRDPEVPGDWFHVSLEAEVAPYFTYVPTAIDLKLTGEEQEIVNQYIGDLQSYVDEMHAKFIIGVEPLSKLDDYYAELDRYGIDQITTAYQAAYDRWQAARE